MNNMDGIERAIAQRQAKIERLQKYVEELREAQRELSVLLEARRIVGVDLGQVDTNSFEQIQRSKRPYSRRGRPTTQRSLVVDILRVVDLTDQDDMAPTEIHYEVEKTRGPTDKRALSSTLSRLVQEGRILRPHPGRYAAIRLEKNTTASLSENGMGGSSSAEEQTQANKTGEADFSLRQ